MPRRTYHHLCSGVSLLAVLNESMLMKYVRIVPENVSLILIKEIAITTGLHVLYMKRDALTETISHDQI